MSLNPSLPPKDLKEARRGFSPTTPYPLVDCALRNGEKQFFQKYYDLGKEIYPWTIIDLLYLRESNQAKLQERFDSNSINSKEKKFLISQIKLTFEIIEKLNPSVIVITNAFTDQLIHNHIRDLNLKQELPSDNKEGIYKINGIPFIRNESRFLGSRIHSFNVEKRLKLIQEIKRVLEGSQVQKGLKTNVFI